MIRYTLLVLAVAGSAATAIASIAPKANVSRPANITVAASNPWVAGEKLSPGDTETTFGLARDLLQPVYSQPAASSPTMPMLQLHTPLTDQGRFAGVILGEYSIDNLLRYAVPTELSAKYAVALLDSNSNLLAGRTIPAPGNGMGLMPWANHVNEDEVPVSPVGNGLILRAQAWRTSLGVVGSGLFWLVSVLSAMTAWMLIANWRHTRRRLHAQNALVAETTFRRAMENSMLTGMAKMEQELMMRKENMGAQFAEETAEFNDKLHAKITSYLQELNANKKYKFVFSVVREGNIFYADSALDITPTMVQALNEKYGK